VEWCTFCFKFETKSYQFKKYDVDDAPIRGPAFRELCLLRELWRDLGMSIKNIELTDRSILRSMSKYTRDDYSIEIKITR
jgi:hypothetical protein